MTEGCIALGRAPEHKGWTDECPDACNHRSHPMDRQLAAPLRLNPTAIGVKEDVEDKRIQRDDESEERGPRLWAWGATWVPQTEEDAREMPPPPAGRCPRSGQLVKPEWKPKASRTMPPAK